MIMYITTVILKRPEREFWRLTPRKFTALLDAHARVTNPEEGQEGEGKSKPQTAFIDQVI